MRIKSELFGRVSGRLRIKENGLLIVDSGNMITDASADIIRGQLGRDFENYALDYIAIGKGGDCDIYPGSHVDTGGRIAPDPSEIEMRVLVEKLPIQITAHNPPEFTFTALANSAQAVNPDINEFGILARNNLLFAHFVTAADLFGRATKKPKTDVNWIIEWTIRYVNV